MTRTFFSLATLQTALVANRAAAGMNLACQKCGEQTLVPKPETRNHQMAGGAPALQ
jgi:hypothetical protein